MRSTHLALWLLAALPLPQPPAPYWPPGDRPTARVYVEAATGAIVTFTASASRGRLWVAAPGRQFSDRVGTTTPAFIDVYGEPSGLSISSSSPRAALRVWIVMGDGARHAATYAGWNLSFHLARGRYVLGPGRSFPTPRR